MENWKEDIGVNILKKVHLNTKHPEFTDPIQKIKFQQVYKNYCMY